MRKLVFVYGTLKQGYGNNRVLGSSEMLGKYTTREKYTLTNCGFPYMIPDSDGEPVSGEVYEVVEPIVMEQLDALEGVSYGHYQHLDILVDGLSQPVTAYVPVNTEQALRYPLCKINSEGEYQWGI